uniref:Uncharacterized protein n=1 Tax=Anopheles christyi TaxID=43041 RepID=A0A182KIF9_9DIPT
MAKGGVLFHTRDRDYPRETGQGALAWCAGHRHRLATVTTAWTRWTVGRFAADTARAGIEPIGRLTVHAVGVSESEGRCHLGHC